MRFKLLIFFVFCLIGLSSCSQATAQPEVSTLSPTAPSIPTVLPTQTPLPPVITTESTLSPTPAPQLGLRLQVINSEGVVNVRSGPGSFYPVVGNVPNNEVLEAVGVDASGTWVQFKNTRAPDGAAWIFAAFTSFSRADNQLPVITKLPTPPVTPTAPPPRAMGTLHVVYADGPVNVRLGPGTNYSILGQVNKGEVLNATGTIDGGDWVQIQFSGNPEEGTAWIYTPYTDYDRASSTLPLVTNLPPTPAP
jgi:stage II sporulation protein P